MTSRLAQIVALLNAGELAPDQFPHALKWLTKPELGTLFDLLTAGSIGTSRERLRAMAQKEHADTLLAKLSKLPVIERGELWLRIQGGEAIEL